MQIRNNGKRSRTWTDFLTDRSKNFHLHGLSKAKGLSVDELQEKIRDDTDTKRLTTEKNVAKMILFLASDKSKNITGKIINVSGGF